MQAKTRYHRVRLIAYDALALHKHRFFSAVPGPSPTPLAPLVPKGLLPSFQRRPFLRKVRLTYETRKIADT